MEQLRCRGKKKAEEIHVKEAKSNSCIVAIHQPETLPWLGFIDKLRQCDIFVLLDHVQFEKNNFQNRNKIRNSSPRGWCWLTVPVLTKGRFGQAICYVEIDNSTNWIRKHLVSIKQNYYSAPYLKHHFQFLEEHYGKEWRRLVDFNVEVIHWLAETFGLKQTILRSSTLGVQGVRSQLLLRICKKLGATVYLSGIAGRNYLEQDLFEAEGINVRFQEFYHPIYPQCYKPFVPRMSSIDLLFNYGDESLEILESDDTPRIRTITSKSKESPMSATNHLSGCR